MKLKKLFLGVGAITAGLVLAACSKEENPLEGLEGTYDVSVWVSEVAGVKELTETQIDAFEEKYPGVVINATVNGVSEKDSATNMIANVEEGADIFCFAQDQLARLVQAGALNKLGVKASETVTELNDAGAVKAATVDGSIYCYPLTSDNGYFMFYDKSVIQESHLDNLEDIIADCEAAGKMFSMELETSGWYNASFFFATGCKSEWTTAEDGSFSEVNDTFNSDAGVVALKGMQKILKSSSYVSSSNTADFAAAIPSAVVISGTWGTSTAKEALGNNFGATDLPSFTVDGNSYHMGSFSGNKLMGVKPQVDAKKGAVLQQLALYLTNEECQTQRFEDYGWGPSNLKAQQSEAVKSDVALSALAAQSSYAIPQGQIHGSWWDISKTYATSAKTATTDAELKSALSAYKSAVDALFSIDPEVARAFTVIGSMNDDGWKTDIPMTESPAGTWKSAAIEFKTGDAFKVRQGKNWDVSFGSGTGDFVVETAGTYVVKFVYDATAGTGTITLEAAN
ncbi:MAG: extracellular solute-binding protein [Anaeroplasma sp.]